MRKILIGFLCSVSLVFVSGAIYAEGHWHSSKIKRIYPTADGGFVLTFVANSPDCPSTGGEKYHYVLDGNNGMTKEGASKIYALALASAAQGKEVNIYFDDSDAKCFINRMYTYFE